MSKNANQKLKLLSLCRVLLQHSDQEHPLTVPELITHLERLGIRAERKSIYGDLEALKIFGLDVQNRKGRSPGWFIGQRTFSLSELKLLVDAVQCAPFLTKEKRQSLTQKLAGLASGHQARQLRRQVHLTGTRGEISEDIYSSVDKLHTAIAEDKAVSFQYFDWDADHRQIFRREGRRYTLSPCALLWEGGHYYLVAYDSSNDRMEHYQVDRMVHLTVTSLPREGTERLTNFDLSTYSLH